MRGQVDARTGRGQHLSHRADTVSVEGTFDEVRHAGSALTDPSSLMARGPSVSTP